MLQTWRDLLFLHQAVEPAALADKIPPELEVDTFDGRAWIGVVPFGMENIRHPLLPAVPGLSSTLEVNVRTYVHHQGVPGVWFFSLDASHPIVVHGARGLYHLPYYRAAMEVRRGSGGAQEADRGAPAPRTRGHGQGGQTQQSMERRDERIVYRSRRIHHGAPAAALSAVWSVGGILPESPPASLEFFLTERYCLYTAHRGRLYRGRIFHAPWPLRSARLRELQSSMLTPLGLRQEGAPLAHHADLLEVEIFRLEVVSEVGPGWRLGSR